MILPCSIAFVIVDGRGLHWSVTPFGILQSLDFTHKIDVKKVYEIGNCVSASRKLAMMMYWRGERAISFPVFQFLCCFGGEVINLYM